MVVHKSETFLANVEKLSGFKCIEKNLFRS